MNESKKIKCPLEFTLSIVGGKWKMVILWRLLNDNVKRYGEIKKQLSGISHKMLSQQLKELAADGLIKREDYQTVPPRVEYSLTEKGRSLMPLLQLAYEWGKENIEEYMEQAPQKGENAEP
ncbi:winged helix-turn-helix transcriptional regulator [Anaerobium acetethylicum]|uniref:DNA-binding transcriptional regulator, HxlR family n=1 Tax=Anaerobium acetethylicum TaxID=1619234 RepID=A0A1D3TZ23_9FIRM|nr:helix-turn-helix domain-containing protein [Anaerobium acetethylicum]SCP99756.1 DNA-binding transcriptional regulator, HxlR family [Anaerobium acetethylicum]